MERFFNVLEKITKNFVGRVIMTYYCNNDSLISILVVQKRNGKVYSINKSITKTEINSHYNLNNLNSFLEYTLKSLIEDIEKL